MKRQEKHILKSQNVFVAQETSRLQEVAKKVGIILPSTHTALFSTIYAKIEEPNGNGIRLAKDAVLESLPGLVGSQTNLEHLGQGFMVGIILDAQLNENGEIVVVFTFAKNIYQEDYIRALEKMQEGKLSVSFELMSERDTQEMLPDGTIRLHNIDWQGMGFLIDAEPAYKKARVFDMAKIYKDRASNSVRELVYASKIVESCDNAMKAYMIDQDGLSMGVTSVTEAHFHVYKLNETGNGGETIATYGDEADHIHEVKDGFVMPGGDDNHTHSFMDQVLADLQVEDPIMSPTNPDMYCACPFCYMPMTFDSTIYDADMNMYHKPCLDQGKISKPWYIKSAKWTTKYINDLPNSSFAVIEPAFSSGKTDNKNARHLPYKDANGKIDLPHYRNALARANQIKPVTDSISADDLRKKAVAELNKHKDVLKSANEGNTEKNQGGVQIMTEEQKKLVAQLRAELEGHLPENITDDDLLIEAKVEEIRKAKVEAEAKAKEEADKKAELDAQAKADAEKAQKDADEKAKVEASQAKVAELETTIEAQKKEIEALKAENETFKAQDKARADAEKAEALAKIKAELKDNQFAKDFKDEDFLNDAKVKEVKILKENADLKAENANLKKNVKTKETVNASDETLPTGSESNNEENPRKLIAKLGKS